MKNSLPERTQQYLDSMRTAIGIDDEMVARFCDSFLRHMPDYIERMGRALDLKDGREFRRLAHSLKSTLNMFGDSSLVDQARELDGLGERGDWGPAPEAFARFSGAMDSLRGDINTIRSRLATDSPR